MQEWQVERQAEHDQAQDPAPGYTPVPLSGQEVDPATFLSVLQRPWLDPELHRVAQQLVDHCDVPLTSATGGLSYRRITLAEALSLIAGLNGQGGRRGVAGADRRLAVRERRAGCWLTEPEKVLAAVEWAMNGGSPQGRDAHVARFRHHRELTWR